MLLTRSKINYLKELDKALSNFSLYIIVVGYDGEYTTDMLQYDSFDHDNNKYKCIRFVHSRFHSVFNEYVSFARIRSDYKIICQLTRFTYQ